LRCRCRIFAVNVVQFEVISDPFDNRGVWFEVQVSRIPNRMSTAVERRGIEREGGGRKDIERDRRMSQGKGKAGLSICRVSWPS
jgi:hypothetical protein